MRSRPRIDRLLQDPRIWQAGRASGGAPATVPAGWPALDEALHGGWPLGQLTELLVDAHGVGEFALLLPALRRLMGECGHGEAGGWAALVSPPYLPYAPALVGAGIELSRLLVIRPAEEADAPWAMEQALRSRACAAVLGWSEALAAASMRRLQLATEASGAWTVLFRPARLRSSRSPAPLRVHLARASNAERVVLSVLKRRGGPPFALELDVGG
jgi:cell division inhibitor SulA/protein ImuA